MDEAALSQALHRRVVRVKEKRLCSLWAGYGSICALTIDIEDDGQTQKNLLQLVGKYVDPPADDGVAHERKVTSYIVETQFYQVYAQRCIDHGINIPRAYFTDSNPSGKVTILMSDLRLSYPIPGSGLNWEKTAAALDWLARFHALHWGNPDAEQGKLWPEGCYWRLDTRLEEFENMGTKWKRLQSAACTIADLLKHGNDLDKTAPPKHRTFVHGDFKSANLQFQKKVDDGTAATSTKGSAIPECSFECAVVDFQYVGAGYGARDLVMLFASSFDMPRQYNAMIQAESDMLRVYHTKLLSYLALFGTNPSDEAYTWEKLTKHYELSLLDYVRFMAGWGMWGNTEYAEQRALELLHRVDGGKCLSSAEYETAIRQAYVC